MAMLAKQAWRLLTDPDSLCARVLKARYYRETSVLEADAKEGISYTWRSILKGVQLVQKGVIARVGYGSSINIWNDPWLPRDWGRQPITPRGHHVLTLVKELMDPVTGGWDELLVDDLFLPQDAQMIKAIPIFEDVEDSWAWHPAPNGIFSVKSAYKLFRVEPDQPGMANPQAVDASFSWSMIWNANITPQAKQFL
jgi:hypothetical protein